MTEPTLILKQTLRKLGLSEFDIKILNYLLHVKMSDVKEISKQTLIPVSTCQFTLKNLLSNELAKLGHNKLGKREVYEPCTEEEFKDWIDERRMQSNKMFENSKIEISNVLSMIEEQSWKPKIQYFEGIDDVKEIYEDIITEQQDLYAFADIANIYKLYPEYTNDYIKRRVEKNIKVKVVSPDSKERKQLLEKSKDELREIKLIPKDKYPFNCEIRIYGDKVAIIKVLKGNPLGTIIEDKEISKMFKLIFNLCWDKTK